MLDFNVYIRPSSHPIALEDILVAATLENCSDLRWYLLFIPITFEK